MKYIVIATLTGLISMPAIGADLDKYKPATPPPKTDFQRALDNPIKPNPPPTAMQKLERGEIPSSANPRPSTEGVSPRINSTGFGVQYEKSFK